METVDCVETVEEASGMVLSVINPPPSSSAWTVTDDCQKWEKYTVYIKFSEDNGLYKYVFVFSNTAMLECWNASLTMVLSSSWKYTPLLVSVGKVKLFVNL